MLKQILNFTFYYVLLFFTLTTCETWAAPQFQGFKTETTQQVRIRNTTERPIMHLKIGETQFNGINAGEESEYIAVPAGAHRIKGRFFGNGNVYFSGITFIPTPPPSQTWTLVVESNRRFSLVSDAEEDTEKIQEEEKAAIRVQVRFENRFPEKVTSVKIGKTLFRNIASEKVSGYYLVDVGTHQVKGEVQGFGPDSINHKIEIPETANRRYTLILDERGTLELRSD